RDRQDELRRAEAGREPDGIRRDGPARQAVGREGELRHRGGRLRHHVPGHPGFHLSHTIPTAHRGRIETMSKKIKELELNALRKTFQGVKDYVLLEPLKLDSATEFEFRKKLRERKCKAQLVKNSFAKKVFTEN